MNPTKQRGGARKGAGRKAGPPTFTRSIRTTAEGWSWLNTQARGYGSVGAWAKASAAESERQAQHESGTREAVEGEASQKGLD
jgi:hypothetical protein